MNKKTIKNIFFYLILIIFFSFFTYNISKAKWINNTNDTETKKVWDAFSKKYDIISFIGKKVGVKNPKSKEHSSSINEYLQIIAYFESHLNKQAKNPNSSASSYFQFINESFKSSLNFIRKKIDPNFPDGKSIFEYSYPGQSQLAINLWYQQAKDSEIKALFNRDYKAGLNVYCSYHHTDCANQLTPAMYTNLKGALKNWSKNEYYIDKNTKVKKNIKFNNKVNTFETKINSDINSLISTTTLTKKEKIDILKKLILKIEKNLKILSIKESNKIPVSSEKYDNGKEDFFCGNLINYPIAKDIKYKKYDVTDLENFLNKYEGENLKVNGIYEERDIEAVKRFQLKYKKYILEPIGLKKPTGEVYNKTLEKINSLYCWHKKQGDPIPKY